MLFQLRWPGWLPPHSSVFKRHVEPAAIKMSQLRRKVTPNSPDLKPMHCQTFVVPCWKITVNSSRDLTLLMPCRPSVKSCYKKTSTRRRWTSSSTWLPTWLRLPMMVIPSICSSSRLSASLQPLLITSKPALLRATNRLLVTHCSEHWEMRCYLVLKRHSFVTFRYISTKVGDKLYIQLFNSCVNFHAKICTHCCEISRVAGVSFSHSPCIYWDLVWCCITSLLVWWVGVYFCRRRCESAGNSWWRLSLETLMKLRTRLEILLSLSLLSVSHLAVAVGSSELINWIDRTALSFVVV